jgi:hypothetical protein
VAYEAIFILISMAISGGILAALIAVAREAGKSEALRKVADDNAEKIREAARAAARADDSVRRDVASGKLHEDDGFRRD